ncbi:lipoate--protein ligase family protein [Nesterenkonia flava]|uniref:Lipoate--protein ligase family protein n=1 Tax=Nesterenkonia flava TaxID=469799 RepID=A0ABU1FRP1_9MICC|nr:lipoate--protein ligase family protein [Nesterenkonia flava]MDR5711324.1 lipoate--protein ligase family protein [Nesterenkonia flava]
MNTEGLLVYRQTESWGAERDLELALDLLAGTRTEETGPMLRLYRPQPTVAFGQRDAKLPGFTAAADACRAEGFEPLVRRAGGRAAAYHPGSLVIDHIEPDADPIRESQARFTAFGELYAEALLNCGMDVELGPIPHEYCYGEHSVHGVKPAEPDVRIKLIGTAQRQIASGWLFSSSIIVEDGRPIRRVLTKAYEAMGLEWDPLTAGAASDLTPEITVDQLEAAVLEVYSRHWSLTEGTPGLLR